MKFSDWIKLREDGVAVGGVGSATVATSGSGATASGSGATESPSDGTEAGSTESPASTGTTTNDVAKRPSVVGCGFCYPLCNCGKSKKNKKRKNKKGKK